MPDEHSARRRTSRLGFLAVGGIAAMVAMGALALTNRESPERYRQSTQVTPPQLAEVADQSKREGRLASVEAPESTPRQPASEAPAPKADPVPAKPPAATDTTTPTPLPVLGRAFMILEVPGSAPNQYEGQANWSFVPDPAGKPGDRFIRLQAEFVAAGLSLDFALSRNSDATLNASHTIFMSFEAKPGLPVVKEMSAIEWRERETQAGTPLIGVLVPIQDNTFMIGLDKSDAAVARNIDLLQSQKWMVFEVRLTNGRRGAVLVEKGTEPVTRPLPTRSRPSGNNGDQPFRPIIPVHPDKRRAAFRQPFLSKQFLRCVHAPHAASISARLRLHRALHLLEGSRLDLADTLTRLTPNSSESCFQRQRIIQQAARLEDAPLALVKHGHGACPSMPYVSVCQLSSERPGWLPDCRYRRPADPAIRRFAIVAPSSR